MVRIPTSADSIDANPVIDADDYDPVEVINSSIRADGEGGQEVNFILQVREDGPAKDHTLFHRFPLQGYEWEQGSDGKWGIVRDEEGKAVTTESRTRSAHAALKRFYMAAMGLTTREEDKVPNDWDTADCHGKFVAVTVDQKEGSDGVLRNNIKSIRISQGGADPRRR